jgi:hypothetical protein
MQSSKARQYKEVSHIIDSHKLDILSFGHEIEMKTGKKGIII